METYQGTRGRNGIAAVTVQGSPRRPMKAIQPDSTELFPAFAQAEADEDRRHRAAERERRIREHRDHLAIIWPEWAGPVAGGPGASGFCEVDTLDAFSLTHGERRYHYMAPCRVESVSADGLTIIAVVEYMNPDWCRDRYNSERLRLDFPEVGPPRAMLRTERDEQPRAATPAPSQDTPTPHPLDTGGRGPVGSSQGRASRPPLPTLQGDVLRPSEVPELQQNSPPLSPMKRTARHTDQDGEQMHFRYRRTRAERIAAGELQEVSNSAKAGGFRWPLAVTPDLWRDVQTVPRSLVRTESVHARWQHIFTLANPAAAQIIRDRLPELKINVVLRTSAAPERDREHIKALCLTLERDPEGRECFALGYCATK